MLFLAVYSHKIGLKHNSKQMRGWPRVFIEMVVVTWLNCQIIPHGNDPILGCYSGAYVVYLGKSGAYWDFFLVIDLLRFVRVFILGS